MLRNVITLVLLTLGLLAVGIACSDSDDAPVATDIPATAATAATATAAVEKLSAGACVGRRGIWAGRSISLGPSALLDIGGIKVVVASLRKQCADPVFFEMFGLDIAVARTVVVKSRGHFRAGFDEYFAPEQVYEVDAPGLTSPVLSRFTFKDLPRPVFPLDEDATWAGPPW